MRKLMTRCYDEILTANEDVVYVGEDVTHGGYYLVTDGLSKKHKRKVADFPPDETTLMGVAIGYSQVALNPNRNPISNPHPHPHPHSNPHFHGHL